MTSFERQHILVSGLKGSAGKSSLRKVFNQGEMVKKASVNFFLLRSL